MKVGRTRTFLREQDKILSESQKQQLETFITRFRSGEQRGKHLHGKWLFEVKIQGKRAYYVSSDEVAVFVGVSKKKDQKEYVRELINREEEFLRLLTTS